jgi:hypothetical protein
MDPILDASEDFFNVGEDTKDAQQTTNSVEYFASKGKTIFKCGVNMY